MEETNKATEFTLSAVGTYIHSVKCSCSKNAAEFAKQLYHADISIYESAFIILLNQAQKAIGWAKISQGGIATTLVDVRIVAKFAIDALATGVIFVHNHPSGNLRSSIPDDKLTEKIKAGLKTLDITLVDSIILAPDGRYYSYGDEGLL